MKLLKEITDLNKAIKGQKRLGFVPTMGCLHEGHVSLIKTSKKKCEKTIVSIFVNPKQFNNKNDYLTYPRNLNKDLKILNKLKVDYVYLPTINQIFNVHELPKITLKKTQNILCAKFRKGHFEGVLDVLNNFVKLISPKSIFMGEKDYQQFFLVKNFIERNYKTKVYACRTVRASNKIALSSRNVLLNKSNINKLSLITNSFFNLKQKIYKDKSKNEELISMTQKNLIKDFKIKIEYIECRNLNNLSKNIYNIPFKLFVAFYLNSVRIIDNF